MKLTSAQNECVDFEWVKQTAGYPEGIVFDSVGNSYITGDFQGTVSIGNTLLTSAGERDGFIAKSNAQGVILWVKQISGATSHDQAKDISIDKSGNIYVTGTFYEEATFGDTTLISTGGYDVFLTKLDSEGNFQWAKQMGGSDHDAGLAIDIDLQGNIYLSGTFQDTVIFGNLTTLTSMGEDDVFIVKLDSLGMYEWVKHIGGVSYDMVNSIAVDSHGNFYLAGAFHGEANFGNTSLSNSGNVDAFITKLDSTGTFLWAKSVGGNSTDVMDVATGIAFDPQGNVYVTGCFSGTATFGSTTLTAVLRDIFITKLDSHGHFEWVEQVVINAFAYGGSGTDIYVDSQGNSYVTGYFSGTATFGTAMYNSLEDDGDIFIARLNSQGDFIWVEHANGQNSHDHGANITMDSQNNIYIIGYFEMRTTLGNTTLLTTTSGQNIVLAKIKEDVISVNTISTDTSINCGSSAQLNAIIAGNTNHITYEWSPNEGLNSSTIPNPMAHPDFTTTYSVEVTNENGCLDTDTITIYVNQAEVDFSYVTTDLKVDFTVESSNVNSISWQFGDGNGSASHNPTHFYSTSGTYDVTVSIVDSCESAAQRTRTILVTESGTNNNDVIIYPNPVSQQHELEINTMTGETIEIELYDLQGRNCGLIYFGVADSDKISISIDLSNLSSGMYVYRLKVGQRTEQVHLVKQ